ncbi:MAG: 3-oxoacyl-[acyl-carrier-protein] reductase [Vampirovibrionales bacterium]|nr:3-oxoacyl-[acyl-carrier-protein] reductase [Vampirovibrionales bacterium]
MTDAVQKVALVTGGSRGIGKACVLDLAAAGYNVAFSYARNAEAAQEVVKAVEALGRKALAVQADAADGNAAQALVDRTVADLGRLDGLVNNAGITKDGLLMRMSNDDWQSVMDTNLSGVFYTLRAAAKVMMKQRSGSIVNITSISGVYGNAGQANYSASKAGVIGLTKSASKELAARNIRVNAVAPGFIATDMTHDLPLDTIAERIPLKRLGEAQDVAKAVTFLITCGDYVTGQVLQVDGGLVI